MPYKIPTITTELYFRGDKKEGLELFKMDINRRGYILSTVKITENKGVYHYQGESEFVGKRKKRISWKVWL